MYTIEQINSMSNRNGVPFRDGEGGWDPQGHIFTHDNRQNNIALISPSGLTFIFCAASKIKWNMKSQHHLPRWRWQANTVCVSFTKYLHPCCIPIRDCIATPLEWGMQSIWQAHEAMVHLIDSHSDIKTVTILIEICMPLCHTKWCRLTLWVCATLYLLQHQQ